MIALALLMTGLVAIILAPKAANPSITYDPNQIQPAQIGREFDTIAVQLRAGQSYAAGLVIGKDSTLTANSDVQTLTISGSPTGGTFLLSFGGQQTTALAYNISAANLILALAALSSIGTGNVTVSLSGSAYTITFQGALANLWEPAIIVVSTSFTGGSSPAAAVVHTTPGNAANGNWDAYASGNSDGTQVAKAILIYQTTVDTFGFHTSGGGEWGHEIQESAPAMTRGRVLTSLLTGLDSTAVSALGRIVDGSVGNLSDPGTVLVLT